MGIKYKVNEKFFETWSAEMAYILGYIYADGSLEDSPKMRGKYLRVTSVEKLAITKIKRLLSSEHTITTENPTWPNGKMRYCLRIGSHQLYESLATHGLFPNKSLTIKFPNVPRKYLSDYVRGYLDGDGCVFLERKRGVAKKLIIKKLTIIFTSGSKDFLHGLANQMKKTVRTHQEKVYQAHRAYQLRYYTQDSIKLFSFLYAQAPQGLYFRRKIEPFLLYFRLRPIKVDAQVRSTLKHLQYGHVVK